MFSKKKEKNLLFGQVVLPVANLALPHELAFILHGLLYWLSSKFIIVAIIIIAIIIIATINVSQHHCHHHYSQCHWMTVIIILMNLLQLYARLWYVHMFVSSP